MTRSQFTVLLYVSVVLVAPGCTSPPDSGAEREYVSAGEASAEKTREAKELHREALEHLDDGEYSEAETVLKEALAKDVFFAPAHNNLGKVYYHTGRYYLAAWEFQYAARLLPDQPEPKNNLGLVFEAVGKLDDAVTEYDQGLALAPDNVHVLTNLARAKWRRGDRGEELRVILGDIVLKDTRPEWISWAEEKLRSLESREVTP